jgi:hypothetical protein
MMQKNDLTQFVTDVAASPAVAKLAAASTTGIGVSTFLGWMEKGVGLTAAIVGLAVTLAIYRKVKLESRESELRIKVLEKRLLDD